MKCLSTYHEWNYPPSTTNRQPLIVLELIPSNVHQHHQQVSRVQGTKITPLWFSSMAVKLLNTAVRDYCQWCPDSKSNTAHSSLTRLEKVRHDQAHPHASHRAPVHTPSVQKAQQIWYKLLPHDPNMSNLQAHYYILTITSSPAVRADTT